MSINSQRGRSAVYRLPGVVALAALGGGGIYAAHRGQDRHAETAVVYRSAAPPKLLRIHSSDGDVDVVAAEGRTVRIEWHANWYGKRPSRSFATRGGVLQLGGGCGNALRLVGGLFSFHSPCAVHYRVELPAGQAVRLEADAGDVELNGLRGRIDVVSHSGDVSADEMAGGARVSLVSDSGDVSALFRSAPTALRAVSSSGDVSLSVPGGSYRVSASTSSGDRSVSGISESSSAARTIDAHTDSGDVSIEGGGR